jgi:beta-ureidopropionase / N-carbamoyl-L-amino-acid hydrolase
MPKTRKQFLALAATLLLSQTLPAQQSSLHVNADRLLQHMAAMGEIGKDPVSGYARVAYTDADLKGREYAIGIMRSAGLNVSIDTVGNIYGRRPGSQPDLTPIMIGSHIDSVPQGGNYDGVVGSLGAIELAQTLAEAHKDLRHPLEVVLFQNEEGGLQGSRAIAGGLRPEDLTNTTRSGKSLRDGIAFIGGDPARLSEAQRKRGEIFGYFELHIQQSGSLDAEKIKIGVVEGIVGNRRWDVTIDGFANHAGTTPMNLRRDALLAAARLIEAVNRAATSTPGQQVATVGRIEALPGAYNVIAGKVTLGIDLRDLQASRMDAMFEQLQKDAAQIAADTNTKFAFHQIVDDQPVLTDLRLRKIVADCAAELKLSTKPVPSGATQDAQSIGHIAPIAMIFIPSVAGISHAPQEFSRPQDIVNGANVLLLSVLQLDSQQM